MAFQVRELMVTVEPARIACSNTEVQCPTASATIFFCGTPSEVTCTPPSGLGLAAPDSRQNLELLRRELAARSAN